jgi:hypothetical protein
MKTRFMGRITLDKVNVPGIAAELVAAFRNAGTRISLFECFPDGGSSEERVLFERVTEAT